MKAGGAIVVMMEIVFTGPKELDGYADPFGNGAGFEHVVVGEAAAKAPTGALHVHDDVVVGNVQDFGDLHAAGFGSLARRPKFEFAVVVMCEAVLWLHGGVRKERIGVGGFDGFRGRLQRGVGIAVLAKRDRRRLLREFVGALLEAFAALLCGRAFVPLGA